MCSAELLNVISGLSSITPTQAELVFYSRYFLRFRDLKCQTLLAVNFYHFVLPIWQTAFSFSLAYF